MKVTSVEKKEKSTVELTIQVEAEAFEAAIQKVYLKNRGRINVPGFRKGKAPRKIIEGMYGASVFYEDAINEAYPAAYDEAVKEQGLDDVGYPKMEIVEVGKDGFTFKALVSVRPEAKLGEYKGITAYKEEPKVTDQDIDGELKPYIDRATRLVSVTRKAKKGDTAVIDFEGFDNGTPFEGGKGENYDLKLGAGMFVPGFEEQVIGMKAGEEKDIDITFPEDYHAELAGKAVIFHVKVNEVKESQAPEVDDEFAKDVSEFETLADFRKDLGDKLLERKKTQAQSDFENAVIEQLVENMECEIPDGMVEVQTDRLMEDYAMRLQSQGMRMEDYLGMMGMSVEMMRASAKPAALKQVQMELALTAVAKAENIQVSDEEFEAEIVKLGEQYNMPADQVRAIISPDALRSDLSLRKASELVLSSAKATKKKPAKKDGEDGEKPKRTRTRKKAEEPAEKTEESAEE
ncbi:trigger factor [Pseudoflavonifractor sp. 60]|uniref:trigger factor n=1 Tax=Pseudoflavonifractor sp. 60 TaxID=2304576 RepID=UPI00136AC221|nr:trigger factor [Pseudoflavonifractor sp. 60]NBI66864.1 trigger factor [Pseudoflavonifractor sp. 60]